MNPAFAIVFLLGSLPYIENSVIDTTEFQDPFDKFFSSDEDINDVPLTVPDVQIQKPAQQWDNSSCLSITVSCKIIISVTTKNVQPVEFIQTFAHEENQQFSNCPTTAAKPETSSREKRDTINENINVWGDGGIYILETVFQIPRKISDILERQKTIRVQFAFDPESKEYLLYGVSIEGAFPEDVYSLVVTKLNRDASIYSLIPAHIGDSSLCAETIWSGNSPSSSEIHASVTFNDFYFKMVQQRVGDPVENVTGVDLRNSQATDVCPLLYADPEHDVDPLVPVNPHQSSLPGDRIIIVCAVVAGLLFIGSILVFSYRLHNKGSGKITEPRNPFWCVFRNQDSANKC